MPVSEQELLSAIAENALAVVGEAEDDDHAQETLAAYEELLKDPAKLKALAARLDSTEDLSLSREPDLSERLKARVRKLAARRYPRTVERLAQEDWTRYRGPHGGQGWQNTSTGEVVYQEERPRGREGGSKSTEGASTGATHEEVEEAEQRLNARYQEMVGEGRNLSSRQYLGQVKDFFPGASRLDPKVAETHVFFDPTADEDENGAASVNAQRYADGRQATAPTVRIGPRGFKGHGSSGSLGDTFVHEVEHLVDRHAGREASEFTPRFRQMMRGLEQEPNLAQFLGRHGRDNAEYHVETFFNRHAGHDLTPEEKAEAVEALVSKASQLYQQRSNPPG